MKITQDDIYLLGKIIRKKMRLDLIADDLGCTVEEVERSFISSVIKISKSKKEMDAKGYDFDNTFAGEVWKEFLKERKSI